MIKLTREQIELDSGVDCRRNWVLKVTATGMSDAEYEEWKAANDDDAHCVQEYEDIQRARNLKFITALHKAATGELDTGTVGPLQVVGSTEVVRPAESSEDPGDDDVNVFVYHAAEPDDPYHGDLFANVASLQDMESLPVGEPVVIEGMDEAENFFPFYRTSSIELHLHNLADAERVWSVIRHDVKMLVYEMWKAKHLKVAEEVVY